MRTGHVGEWAHVVEVGLSLCECVGPDSAVHSIALCLIRVLHGCERGQKDGVWRAVGIVSAVVGEEIVELRMRHVDERRGLLLHVGVSIVMCDLSLAIALLNLLL